MAGLGMDVAIVKTLPSDLLEHVRCKQIAVLLAITNYFDMVLSPLQSHSLTASHS